MSRQSTKEQGDERGKAGEPVSDADTASYSQPQGESRSLDQRNPRMPHERDESARATGERRTENPVPSDRQISDAGSDVEQGRVDTDRRGVPNDVPGGSRSTSRPSD